MTNKISSLVFDEFHKQDICLTPQNDESPIDSVARLDA